MSNTRRRGRGHIDSGVKQDSGGSAQDRSFGGKAVAQKKGTHDRSSLCSVDNLLSTSSDCEKILGVVPPSIGEREI